MKILFSIAEQHPTYRADVAILFGKYLPRLGIETDILTIHDPAQAAPPAWPGGRALTIAGSAGRLGKHLRKIMCDLRMLWLARRGYDAIQVRDKAFAALVGLLAARLYGIKFYYWMSFPMAEAWVVFARERGRSVGVLRWLTAWLRGRVIGFILYRVVLPRADHVFVQSKRMKTDVERRGIAPAKMTPVPMGVDPDSYNAAPTSDDGHCTADAQFVYLGTINRIRNPDLMLNAVSLAAKENPAVKLLLVGDADEEADRKWLRSMIAENGLEDTVQITGWMPVTDALRLASNCIAGLSPFPRGELFESASPTKAVEYLALGLPVIANDQPDQAEVLASTGTSCAELTPAGFAKAMLAVLKDPAPFQAQAAAGRSWVLKNRGYDAIAADVASVYRSSIDSKTSAS